MAIINDMDFENSSTDDSSNDKVYDRNSEETDQIYEGEGNDNICNGSLDDDVDDEQLRDGSSEKQIGEDTIFDD